MSSQEDINVESPMDGSKDVFEPKQTPKIIRVLTVLAYVLSVSMAAILLSIYYIFVWQGHPHIGAQRSDEHLEPSSLALHRYIVDYNDANVSLNFYNYNETYAKPDVVSHQTKPNDNPEEKPTTLLPITSTEEDEENTTWPDYSEFEQKKKRSVFIKKIMNFKDEYMDTN